MLSMSERIREERIKLGMNQTEFGALAGVTKTSQINYEKGTRSPDANYLQALSEHGIDVCYVITGNRAEQKENVDAELEYLADAWEAIDYALDQAKKYLPANKKRQAAKALYMAFKEGEIQDFERGANLLLAAA